MFKVSKVESAKTLEQRVKYIHKLTIKTLERRLGTYFALYSTVAIAEFEQINAG